MKVHDRLLPNWTGLVVFGLLFSTSLLLSAQHERPSIALVETTRVAQSLASSGEFSNPFYVAETGPTAHVAPVFPAMASLVFGWSDSLQEAHPILYWAAAMALAGQVALLPYLARVVGLGWWAGLWASLLALLANRRPVAQWEGEYVALLMMILTGLVATRTPYDGSIRWGREAMIGLFFGLLILSYPIAVIVWVVFVGWDLWRARHSHTWSRTLVVVVISVSVLMPWLIRNAQLFGEPVFVRDNLGIEMAVSFNPCAGVSLFDNMLSGCFREWHPNRSPEQASLLIERGEVGYNGLQMSQALDFIAEQPRHSANLVLRRTLLFWWPSAMGDPIYELTAGPLRLQSWVVYLSTLLAFVGLALAFIRQVAVAPLLLAWMLLLPAPYFFLQFSVRYRTPMLWVTFLLAGISLHALVKGVFNPRRDPDAQSNQAV